MILKLRLVDKERGSDYYGWVYADKVRQVFRKLNDIRENGEDWTNMITVIYENGKDEQFLIQHVAYLLNDDGKTVDTFYHEEEKKRSQSIAEIALDKERVYKSIMKEKEEEQRKPSVKNETVIARCSVSESGSSIDIMLDDEILGRSVIESINKNMKGKNNIVVE